jgi:two-component system OmpR family sensor kinase
VRQCLEDMAPRMAAAAVTLQIELAGGARVACGGTLLRQVVDNLVGNAIKHLAGQLERRLEVRIRHTGSAVCLEVEDSGPGIPPDAATRIFEPFYRVPGCNVPGNGIGLATVRRIVEAHGGEIAVSSVVGQGSVFRIRLPAAGPERAPVERPTRVMGPPSTEPVSNTQGG